MPASGTIRMSQINSELGRSSTAQISLDTAENGGYATINTASTSRPSSTNPASMSEWYGYNHNASSSSTIYWYCYRTGPNGGNLIIRKNGTTVVSSITNGASGTFTAAAGDTIVVTMSESPKVSDETTVNVTVYGTGAYVTDGAGFDSMAVASFTVSSGVNYVVEGSQFGI